MTGMRTLGIVAALLSAGVLAGCGSGSATDGTTTTGATTTVTRTATETTPTATSSTSATTTTTSVASSPSATATDGGSSTAGNVAACRAPDLALSFLGGQGATGHGELGFALRNTTQTSCRTYGYPGVQFLDRAGKALPTIPTHTTDDFFGHTTETPLTVAPGQSVSFRLGVSHVGTSGSGSGCTTAGGLQVIPPDDTETLRVTIPGGAAECGGRVTVSPLQPGTSALR